MDFGELEGVLGYRFGRGELLRLAMTHRSYVYDGAGNTGTGQAGEDNEQLEFVGDAVLGLLVAEALYRRFPEMREGELTRLRASVVSRKFLGTVGARLGLGKWLRLGHTAEKNDGRRNETLFANAMEALIAAVYLDGGLEVARGFVEREVLPGLTAAGGGTGEDYKTALQERLQATGARRPEYRVVEESGPAHKKVFRVEVWLEGGVKAVAEAAAGTKKQAQQEAARLALEGLKDA